MISLGGITRLTGSGLSMVEWAPITGILPPLGETQWLSVFKLYQATPEYMQVNAAMDLDGFKSIFWFEYVHRLLGRLIGSLFFIPMLYFFVRYPLPASLRLKLGGLFLLGAAQGLLGWYMVKSGLIDNPRVSQYRLVAHLALALSLYSAIFWLASGYFVRKLEQRYRTPRVVNRLAVLLVIMAFLTMLAGGFVAGTRAGFAFNTFPLMNGHWLPEGYGALLPLWKNPFENIAAIQFNHRLLATITLLTGVVLVAVVYRCVLIAPLKRFIYLAVLLLLSQYTLGIVTLLAFVPVVLGAAHQLLAVLVLSACLLAVRTLAQVDKLPLSKK